tara:strand:+ start:355 stop:1488 length:1134 start_codon:yes stop_codon:yes gene_type:complete
MKWTVILSGLLLVGILGFWLLGTPTSQVRDIDSATAVLESVDAQAQLTVPAQTDTETVTITEATLTKPGFIVVREIIAGTAGQIVEISPYFDAGTYADIKIPIGPFYTGENELIVLIYTDAQNDQVLNDLDQPFVDENDDFVARFVATGNVVANTVIEADMSTVTTDVDVQTVTYTGDGFTPATLEVAAGTAVRFVNESGMPMWVASDVHPAHTDLPTFDQFKPGDVFVYTFEEAGVWNYHDHINPTAVGAVTVTERANEVSTEIQLPKNEQGYIETPSDVFSTLVDDPDTTVVNVHIPYGGEIAGTDAFVPYNDTEALLAALPEDKSAPVALYCRSGGMSAVAAQAVVSAGYENVYDLSGGMNAYRDSGREVIVKN